MPESVQHRILVVDDEPLNQELLKRVLQKDYEVELAGCASDALAVLEKHHGDVRLILCDQLMPGLTGTELAAQVQLRWPHVQIILLTGFDDDDAVVQACRDGHVCDVIAKPWRSTALRAVIEQVISAS